MLDMVASLLKRGNGMVQTVRCKNDLIKYRNALNKIEAPFKGLPYVNVVLIQHLIGIADVQTGIVGNTTYCKLANYLIINPAPGRRDSGTPTKQTIRNYIKSIEHECGEFFKVISEGQALKFCFPQLPKIFNTYFKDIEANTEVNIDLTQNNVTQFIEKREEKVFLSDEVNIEVNTDLDTEVNTPTPLVKNINNKYINNNNNNNNNTNKLSGFSDNQKTKQRIASDFHPSQEILERAFASGYSFAADADVIQEFIDKNLSWGSQFADFNPVYLSFLAKHNDHKKQPETQKMQTRSNSNDRPFTKANSHDEAMARVKADHPNAIAPSESELFPASQTICVEAEHTPYRLVVGGVDESVRPIVYQQKRV